MKTIILSLLLLILLICSGFFGLDKSGYKKPFHPVNSLSFGGGMVTVDVTDCSPENSPDKKNRAIAAINTAGASMCTVQFGVVAPAAGTYITVMEEPIGIGQVILGAGGTTFGGAFLAGAGQSITITSDSGKYRASFNDIKLIDPLTRDMIGKKISGDFGCD